MMNHSDLRSFCTLKTFLTSKNWQRWCLERLTIVCSSTAVDLNFEFPPIRSAAPTTYPQSNFQEVPLLKIKIYGNALSGSATHLQHTSTVDWRTWLELNIMPKPLVLDMFIFVWVILRVLLSSFARDWAQEIIKLMWPSAKHRLHILRIEHSKLNTKHWEHRIKQSVQCTEHIELGQALKNWLSFCQGFFCLTM